MNKLSSEMLNILKDLRDNHNVIGIKAEFEAEGSRTDELVMLNEVVFRADMDMVIKIGGCEAVRDLDQCRLLGASGIMAPMIETSFAMSKFIGAINKVYNEEEKDRIQFIINTETITCFNNLDEILNVKGAETVKTVVVGRVDLSGSMGLSRTVINDNEVLDITRSIVNKTKTYNKIVGVGGGISFEAIPFIERLYDDIDKFETRKVIFKKDEIKNQPKKAILKAMKFETLYLKHKFEFYDRIAKEDVIRINMLEKRIGELESEI